MRDIVRAREDVRVLYPVHLNPLLRAAARKRLKHPRIALSAPLDYPAFVAAASSSDLILTDSGGLQEEAVSLGVPVLLLRDVADRPEALRSGLSVLVGTRREKILKEALKRLKTNFPRRSPRRRNPFGDGRSSMRIAREIRAFLCPKSY